MAGSLRCCNCNTALDVGGSATGICPKCNKPRHVFVWIYWQGNHVKITEDKDTRQRLEFLSGKLLLEELRNRITKARKAKKPFDLSPWLPARHNPNIAEKRLEEWLEHLAELVEKNKFARSTWRNYSYTVRNHFIPVIGEKDLSAPPDSPTGLQYSDLDRMFTFLSTSIESARTHRGTLKAFLKWCWKMGYVKQLPPMPSITGKDKKAKYVLTRAQQAQAIGRLPERFRDVVWLMVYTGCRVSEALTLKLSDANADRTTLTIQRTWSGGRIKDATKKYRPRTLPLNLAAAEIFRRAAGDRVGKVWLFPNPATGMPYTPNNFCTIWKKYSGFPDVPLKDATRRSRATQFRNAGVHMDAVRAYLGHTSSKVTQEYLDEDVEWVRDELDAAEARLLELEQQRAARGGESNVENSFGSGGGFEPSPNPKNARKRLKTRD